MENAFEAIRTMEAACKQMIQQEVLKATGAKTYTQQLAHDLFVKTYGKKK
jgi:hypothetical protein